MTRVPCGPGVEPTKNPRNVLSPTSKTFVEESFGPALAAAVASGAGRVWPTPKSGPAARSTVNWPATESATATEELGLTVIRLACDWNRLGESCVAAMTSASVLSDDPTLAIAWLRTNASWLLSL